VQTQKSKKMQKIKKTSGLCLFSLQMWFFCQKEYLCPFFQHLFKASKFLINAQKVGFLCQKRTYFFIFTKNHIKNRLFTPQHHTHIHFNRKLNPG